MFFLLLLLASCCFKTETERKIDFLLSRYGCEADLSKTSVIIIPLNGCGACVNTALEFMKNEWFGGNYIFILESPYKKDFAIKIGKKISSSNIIYDTLNYSISQELVFNTPVVYIKGNITHSINLHSNEDYMKMIDEINKSE